MKNISISEINGEKVLHVKNNKRSNYLLIIIVFIAFGYLFSYCDTNAKNDPIRREYYTYKNQVFHEYLAQIKLDCGNDQECILNNLK